MEILYRIIGKGTLMLSEKEKGEEIDLIGPLGNGFNLKQNFKTAIIVAGGIGVAPLFSLTKVLKKAEGSRLRQKNLIVLSVGKLGRISFVLRTLKE